MRTLEEYKKAGSSVYDKLHLQTYPVAIKYIRDIAEMPEGSLRPSEMGQQASLCQAFTYARRFGFTITMTGVDNFCTAATAWHLWDEATPDEIIHSQIMQGWHKDLEAERGVWDLYVQRWGKNYQDKMKGYIGFVCAPLHDAKLIPDTVLIYGNSLNMMHLIHAMVYDGKDFPSSDFTGFGESCQKGGFVPFIIGVPQIVIPGFGDHSVAAAHETEIAIGMPAELVFKVDKNLFLTGGGMNVGQPPHTMMAMSLTEGITPGWPYLRDKFEAHKNERTGH
jgi:uncharacterized protein (DUF169 family)